MFEDKDFLNLDGVKFIKADKKIKDAPKFRFVQKASSKLKSKTHNQKISKKTKTGEEVPEQYLPAEGETPKEIIPHPHDLFVF